MTPQHKLQTLMSAMSTASLLDAWEATNADNREDIPTVRGWIMDELERRAPVAFEAWMLADGAPEPNAFFQEEG